MKTQIIEPTLPESESSASDQRASYHGWKCLLCWINGIPAMEDCPRCAHPPPDDERDDWGGDE
jgi:hypothetical protein